MATGPSDATGTHRTFDAVRDPCEIASPTTPPEPSSPTEPLSSRGLEQPDEADAAAGGDQTRVASDTDEVQVQEAKPKLTPMQPTTRPPAHLLLGSGERARSRSLPRGSVRVQPRPSGLLPPGRLPSWWLLLTREEQVAYVAEAHIARAHWLRSV